MPYELTANNIDAPSTSMAKYFIVSPTNTGEPACNVITVTAFSDATASTPFTTTNEFTFTGDTNQMSWAPTTAKS